MLSPFSYVRCCCQARANRRLRQPGGRNISISTISPSGERC